MNKTFICTVALHTTEVRISAKNKTEARKKLKERLKKKPAGKLVDWKNSYISQW